MEPENKKLDTPYTKDDLVQTDKSTNQRVKDCIQSVIVAYLTEFEEYALAEAQSTATTILPVVLCLVEDGMRTGEYVAERRIAQMLMQATGQQMTGGPPMSSSQN